MQLNLTRSWRPRSFDDLVGQELVVRILKNSLYKQQIMPVYILTGLYGCGKTTVGRLFAAAINCACLSHFRNHPREQSMPCGGCDSCKNVFAGTHPDFMEIDAASYTGVDHVRTIIESASFLPVQGIKKIYLIDEAHMLSRSAFNALLKMLEEPPTTVLFMLATTELHKIPQTVRSRAFHLFFNALSLAELTAHVTRIAHSEGISAQPEALQLIARAARGSARDAVMLLNQLALTGPQVTVEVVRSVAGLCDDTVLGDALSAAAQRDRNRLMPLVAQLARSGTHVWQRVADLLRALMWAHSGIPADDTVDASTVQRLLPMISADLASAWLSIWCDYEIRIARTTALAAIYVDCWERCMQVVTETKAENVRKILNEPSATTLVGPRTPALLEQKPIEKVIESSGERSARACTDPVIAAALRTAVTVEYARQRQTVVIQFAHDTRFFDEWIGQRREILREACAAVFGEVVSIEYTFSETVPERRPPIMPKLEEPTRRVPQSGTPSAVSSGYSPKNNTKKAPPQESLSSEAKKILELFPGTVQEL